MHSLRTARFCMVGIECGAELWQLFQPVKAFLGFLHGSSRPTERHRGRAPTLHVATDTTHRPHHVLDNVGTRQGASQLGRQPEPSGRRQARRVLDVAPDCGSAFRPARRHPSPRLGEARGGPRRASPAPDGPSCSAPYEFYADVGQRGASLKPVHVIPRPACHGANPRWASMTNSNSNRQGLKLKRQR
jgi:hypothetical protein